ncbi:MAG: hypothetical protein ACTSUW_01655 [Candidatus Heimdallarchaeota archaeon]
MAESDFKRIEGKYVEINDIMMYSNHDCFITQKEIFNQLVINYLLKQIG